MGRKESNQTKSKTEQDGSMINQWPLVYKARTELAIVFLLGSFGVCLGFMALYPTLFRLCWVHSVISFFPGQALDPKGIYQFTK